MKQADISKSPRYDELITDARVHSSLYTDERVFEDELNKIFRMGWFSSVTILKFRTPEIL